MGRDERARAAVGAMGRLCCSPADPAALEAVAMTDYEHDQISRARHAASWLRRAVHILPGDGRLLNNQGVVLQQAGAMKEAASAIRRALVTEPSLAPAHNSRGVIARGSRGLLEAMTAHARALAIDGMFIDAYLSLAYALREGGSGSGAITTIRRALALRPDHPTANWHLGGTILGAGLYAEARPCLRRAIALDPRSAAALTGLATAIQQTEGKANALATYVQALAVSRRALALGPSNADLCEQHAHVLRGLEHLGSAVTFYARSLSLGPPRAEVLNTMAMILQDQGRLESAIDAFRAASRLAPDDPAIMSNLLFALCFSEKQTPQQVYDEHRAFDRIFGLPRLRRSRPHSNDPDPSRRLRVGYMSPDFRRHPGGYFFEAFLRNHDRRAFEVVSYNTNRHVDDLTARLSRMADRWRVLTGLDDEDLAEEIRSDEIDILVECTGHMAGNRLMTFALKPAPVQVSFPLYPNTTGLSAIDYRIADPYFAPPSADAYHSERLVRLPDVHVCYTPDERAPVPASRPPMLRSGYVTLGCFNNFAKVREPVVALWSRILSALPEARLMLKWSGMDDPNPVWVHERFARHGISPSRIVTLGFQPSQYDAYLEVDISLDPFPGNGGTTTCDSLWMGVPVVTLVGEIPFSRVGLCHLTNVGLSECIAREPDEYAAIVVGLARDPRRLASIRSGLRERVAASPLTDGRRYTRNLENAYRRMWSDWCERSTSGREPSHGQVERTRSHQDRHIQR